MNNFSSRKGLVFIISLTLLSSALHFNVAAETIITDNSADAAGTGDSFIVNVTVTDTDGVESVWLDYRFGSGTPTNVSMTNTAGNYWEYESISIPLESDEDLYYNISVRNTTGSWCYLLNQQVVVTDDDLPTISNVQAIPDTQEEYRSVNISCGVDAKKLPANAIRDIIIKNTEHQ